jgi:teichuronic acid biosynthesis glycosyltransferase TuaG
MININQPLISIIMPVYNAEEYIAETIESVLNQTYENWELIIVDDYSNDTSIEIIKQFTKQEKRIKLIESKNNFGGPARPRNIGINNSYGEYIAFLDADDLWQNIKLEKQLNYMIENNLNFTSTSSSKIDHKSNKLNDKYNLFYYLRSYTNKSSICDLIKYSYISTSSVVIEKKIVLNFNEDIDFISVEDLCLWLEILKNSATRYRYLDEELLQYRILFTSISDRNNIHKQRTKANICILKFILKNNYFKIINCFYLSLIKTMIVSFVRTQK